MMNGDQLGERDLMKLWVARVPERFPFARPFPRDIYHGPIPGGGYIEVGIPGMGDAYVYLEGGFVIEVEAKAVKHKWRASQIRWKAWCERARIPWLKLVVKRGESSHETVERWCDELGTLVEAIGYIAPSSPSDTATRRALTGRT